MKFEQKLEKIQTLNGEVLKIFRSNGKGAREIYCSSNKINAINAWKLNIRLKQHLVVITGKVHIAVFNQNFEIEADEILSKHRYTCLNIPPNYWYGFKTLEDDSIILNYLDEPFDAKLTRKKNIGDIEFNWEKS